MIDFIKGNKTLRELLVGITLVAFLFEIVILVMSTNKISGTLGLLIGTVASYICAVYMAYSIDIAVELDEKSSIAYMRKGTVYRYIMLCIVLIIIGATKVASPVTLIFGFLTLKFGAYINPFIHRLFNKNNTHKNEISNDINEHPDSLINN